MFFTHVSTLVVSLLIAPITASATQPARSTPSAINNKPPCENMEGAALYRCRRFEAQSYIRELLTEYNKLHNEQIREMRTIAKELTSGQKSFYATKTTQAERDAFRSQLTSDRLKRYHDWRVQYNDFLSARRNLRKELRVPSNRDLRLRILTDKSEFRRAIGSTDKQTRRGIVDAKVRSYRTYK